MKQGETETRGDKLPKTHAQSALSGVFLKRSQPEKKYKEERSAWRRAKGKERDRKEDTQAGGGGGGGGGGGEGGGGGGDKQERMLPKKHRETKTARFPVNIPITRQHVTKSATVFPTHTSKTRLWICVNNIVFALNVEEQPNSQSFLEKLAEPDKEHQGGTAPQRMRAKQNGCTGAANIQNQACVPSGDSTANQPLPLV